MGFKVNLVSFVIAAIIASVAADDAYRVIYAFGGVERVVTVDGSIIASSGTFSNSLYFWNGDDGSLISTKSNYNYGKRFDMTPDSAVVVLTDYSGDMQGINTRDATNTFYRSSAVGILTDIKLTADGKYVYTCDYYSVSVNKFNVFDGSFIQNVYTSGIYYNTVFDINADGSVAVVGGGYDFFHVVNTLNSALKVVIPTYGYSYGAKLNADGSLLVFAYSFSPDGNGFKVYNTNDGSLIRTVFVGYEYTDAMAVSPDFSLIAIDINDYNKFKVFDINSGEELQTYYGHTDNIISMDFTSDSNTIISGSYDGTIRFWSTKFGCPPGTFMRPDGSCSNCPVGTYNPTKGSTGISACMSCPPGTFSDKVGSAACTQCQPGTYNPDMGSKSSNACQKCPSGTYSSYVGATTCMDCPPGTFNSVTGQTMCRKCSAGTFNSFAGSKSSSVCKICPAGTFSMEGQGVCTLCPPGTFNGNIRGTGPESCVLCPDGKFNPHFGASSVDSCLACPAGSYAGISKSNCDLCPEGTFNSLTGGVSISVCKPCQPGYFNPTRGAANENDCKACPEGTFSEGGRPQCMLCPPGTYNGNKGSFSMKDCKQCPAGTFSNVEGAETSKECLSCPVGTYSRQGQKDCTLCPAGTYSDEKKGAGIGSCKSCPQGTYNPLQGVSNVAACLKCPAGTKSSSDFTTCVPQ